MHKRMQRGVWMAAAVLGLGATAAVADDRGMEQKTRQDGATYQEKAGSRGTQMTEAERGRNDAVSMGVANRLALHDQQLIELAKMAEEKSRNPEVKSFAKELLKDQEAHLSQIEQWAGRNQVQIAKVDGAPPGPAIGGGGDVEKTEEMKKIESAQEKWTESRDRGVKVRGELAALEGDAFDKRFIKEVKHNQEQARDVVRKARKDDAFKYDQAMSAFLVKSETSIDDNLAALKRLEE